MPVPTTSCASPSAWTSCSRVSARPYGAAHLAPTSRSIVAGDLEIDLAAARVRRGGEDVRLTPTEWHVLEVLVRQRGRLVPRVDLLREVWGPAYETETNYLRVYLAQLRRKLESDSAHPRHLVTEPGLGYRFET